MKYLTLALLFAVACGGSPTADPECVTRCGLRLSGTAPLVLDGQPQWSCEELQRTETAILAAFADVKDPRFADACSRISGWTISVAPGVFLDEAVGGRTDCSSGTLTVNNLAPLNSTLAHELGHVVQQCRPRGPGDHGAWDEDGITAALAVVSSQAYAQYRRCYGTTACQGVE